MLTHVLRKITHTIAIGITALFSALAEAETLNSENPISPVSPIGPISPTDTALWNRRDMSLSTIVVTATRTPKALADIPIVTRVITSEDIEKVDATNIRDMLQQELPGLEFTYSMGQQVLNMGGYDGNNILFLIDGERMAGESIDNIDFARLDLSNVERIEIVKGAASTLYGSAAMGGVINIITKSPSKDWTAKVHSRYEGQTREWRHGASGQFSVGRVNSLTTFQMTRNDSLPLHGEESSLTTAYGGKTYNIRERLVWDVTKNWQLTARGGFFFRERDNSTLSHERYRDLNYGLRSNLAITSLQDLEIAYSFDQYDKSDYALKTERDVRDYSNRQNIARALYNLQLPSWKSVVTAGFDYMNDYLMSYQFSGNSKSRTQNSYDVFAQWDYTPSKHWNIIGGLRFDYFSAARKGMPTWKLAALYKTGRHSLRASYASGFRAPSLKELYMDFYMAGIFMIYGNPDLRCETNHNFSLSWTNYGSISDHLKYCITTAGYFNFFHDYITTASVTVDKYSYLKYTNVNNQKIVGADATLQLHHMNGLGLRLSYAFVKNIVEGSQPDLTKARPHSLTWRLDYDHQFTKCYSITAALSGRWLSPVDATEFTTTGLTSTRQQHYEGYCLWKVSLSQRFFKGVALNIAVDNIFNYRPRNYYPNSPLTLGTTATIGVAIDIEKLF